MKNTKKTQPLAVRLGIILVPGLIYAGFAGWFGWSMWSVALVIGVVFIAGLIVIYYD